jgi:hypothetical protein
MVAAVGARLDGLLEQLTEHQRGRVLSYARRIDPRLSADDILQPDDYPKLRADPEWNYEDGVLAGMMAAQMAIRAELRRAEVAGPGTSSPGATG